MTVKLGDKCRDTITNFEGICVAITVHLNGCLHIGLEAAADTEAKLASKFDVFDIQRIEIIEAGAFKAQDHGVNPPGGPNDGRTVRAEDHRRA